MKHLTNQDGYLRLYMLKLFADFALQYVILVGGFGNSRYLLKYLKLRLQGVEVLQCGGSEP